MTEAYKNREWKVFSASSTLLSRYAEQSGVYIEGPVETPYGYVYAYSSPKHTDLRFICWERMYYRSFDRSFTKKGLARIAGKFAEEIAFKVDKQKREARL